MLSLSILCMWFYYIFNFGRSAKLFFTVILSSDIIVSSQNAFIVTTEKYSSLSYSSTLFIAG